jgi:hypothetical protein
MTAKGFGARGQHNPPGFDCSGVDDAGRASAAIEADYFKFVSDTGLR